MYSIGTIAKLTNLSISTLRYYDKIGLLPNIKRNESGIREFDNNDIQTLRVIECLKISGMQLSDIKTFMEWCLEGDKTISKRLNMFNNQKKAIEEQISSLNTALEMIKFKQWYYGIAEEEKTEKNVKKMKIEDMPTDIQLLYTKTH